MEKIVKTGLRDCTVNLDGTECAVRFDGCFRVFAVRNDSSGDVYISKTAGIAPDADGVMSVKAGASTVYAHMDMHADTVYLLGKGKVQLHAQNDVINPFNYAPAMDGGEERGESSYTIENAVDYPVMGLNLYGKSTQDGTPTPENPVDIVSVGDSGSVGITACGKNFLNPNMQTTTKNGVTCTNNGDGTYTLNGTATETVAFYLLENDNTLITCGTYKTLCSADNNIPYAYNFETKGWTLVDSNQLELGQSDTLKEMWIKIYKGYECNNVIIKPMLTTDLSATYDDFEPHKSTAATLTSALPLCGIPVESGGNYTDSNGQQWVCDELIYNSDGTGKIVKRTAKIDSYNGESITTPYISTTGSLSTGATVIYQIAEPQEIELTAAEMSALRELQSFNGVTNIFNDDGAEISVNYCSNKTLSEYVMPITIGLQKQIDELKSAVLSLGGNV